MRDDSTQPPPDSSLVSRRQLLTAGAAVALLVTAGCGSNGSSASNDSPRSRATTDTTSGTSGRTVRHRYGTTTVPAEPERVLTIGLVDHDAALALGVVPIAITADAYSEDQPHGVWTWARDELGDHAPEVLPANINYERIAALQPDLILAVSSGLSKQEYATLSRIAPTVAQSDEHEDYLTPWDEMTHVIGHALGQEDAAKAAIDRVHQMFADVRAQHPEFAGKEAVYGGVLDAGQYYAEGQRSTRAAILTGLGFTIADELPRDELYVEVSREQIELFEQDLLLWELGDLESRETIESDPLYRRLDAVHEGRDVFVTDPDLAGALALISVLSLPYAIERLVPELAAAVDGDPATRVPA
jgi:iron complex transport system substrate-binding protein